MGKVIQFPTHRSEKMTPERIERRRRELVAQLGTLTKEMVELEVAYGPIGDELEMLAHAAEEAKH